MKQSIVDIAFYTEPIGQHVRMWLSAWLFGESISLSLFGELSTKIDTIAGWFAVASNYPPAYLFGLGIFVAFWFAVALWVFVRSLILSRRAKAVLADNIYWKHVVSAAPYIQILLRSDDSLEVREQAAIWLGLDKIPTRLSDLSDGHRGIDANQYTALCKAIEAARRGAKKFTFIIKPIGGERSLLLSGAPAPEALGGLGAVLMWLEDVTDNQQILADLARERDEAIVAFESLSGLTEASPLPMWFRNRQARLTLVNRAYVQAVEADSAERVIEQNIELVETNSGVSALAMAQQAVDRRETIKRIVPVTIRSERRMSEVVDVPLFDERENLVGIAGYVIDVQDLETTRAEHRRFVTTQRAVLDRLSTAVAQFTADRNLVFFNNSFQHLFSMQQSDLESAPNFAHLIDSWRDRGYTPEVRDFAAWRAERLGWFALTEAVEDDWRLNNGKSLHLIAHPSPDGGLLLVVEDRTEHVQLAATRDSLLRVRTSIFDNLYEAVAVFAPDGRLQLSNKRIRAIWSVSEDDLADKPRIDSLVEKLTDRVAKPEELIATKEAIRDATLGRTQRDGSMHMADGTRYKFSIIPLPDGNALLIMIESDHTDNV